VLLSIVGIVWVGVPLWLFPGISPIVAMLVPATAFLVITGAVLVRSSRAGSPGRWRDTCRARRRDSAPDALPTGAGTSDGASVTG